MLLSDKHLPLLLSQGTHFPNTIAQTYLFECLKKEKYTEQNFPYKYPGMFSSLKKHCFVEIGCQPLEARASRRGKESLAVGGWWPTSDHWWPLVGQGEKSLHLGVPGTTSMGPLEKTLLSGPSTFDSRPSWVDPLGKRLLRKPSWVLSGSSWWTPPPDYLPPLRPRG